VRRRSVLTEWFPIRFGQIESEATHPHVVILSAAPRRTGACTDTPARNEGSTIPASGSAHWTGPEAASARFFTRRHAFGAARATAKRLLQNDKRGGRRDVKGPMLVQSGRVNSRPRGNKGAKSAFADSRERLARSGGCGIAPKGRMQPASAGFPPSQRRVSIRRSRHRGRSCRTPPARAGDNRGAPKGRMQPASAGFPPSQRRVSIRRSRHRGRSCRTPPARAGDNRGAPKGRMQPASAGFPPSQRRDSFRWASAVPAAGFILPGSVAGSRPAAPRWCLAGRLGRAGARRSRAGLAMRAGSGAAPISREARPRCRSAAPPARPRACR
jgi:hypothetical protein